jgi:hypothetical protein
MLGICSKCGASIKNIVDINGKSYGTSCAETVLGIRLPKNYSGDGVGFKKKLISTQEENVKRFKETIEMTIKGWNINIYFTRAYRAARNDWERSFVGSCASQTAATLLINLDNGLSFDDAKRDWNHNYMGSFPYRDYDLNDTFNSLSEKQLSILNRIHEIGTIDLKQKTIKSNQIK